MRSFASRRHLAAVVAGAALAGATAAPGASAHFVPLDPSTPGAVRADVPPPPSSIAASARKDYERLRERALGPRIDLRSPDTKDVADGYRPKLVPAAAPSEPTGFDLPSAAIGAAAGTGLLLVLAAGGTLVRRHPRAGRRAIGA